MPNPPRPPPAWRGNRLFTLIPCNDEARLVVDCNPGYIDNLPGVRGLACHIGRPSNVPGRLLSFGRNILNDIRLPPGPAGDANVESTNHGKGGRTYQNYRNNHFFFFLAASGELILRDLSPSATTIEIADSDQHDASLYALHGESPRQRVIPRTDKAVYITFGASTTFRLSWAPRYQTEIVHMGLNIQDRLAAEARTLHARGMTITAPAAPSPHPPMHHSRELRSRYTPSGGSSLTGVDIPIHRYAMLGEGTFGRVYKAVDLTSGELWAVKEIKDEAKDDSWKECFVRKVEILLGLSHENIVHFETYQGFCLGGQFQLFFRLYKGSLSELIPTHRYDALLPVRIRPPPWWERLVKQMASALEYLHEKEVVHMDVKPENIMYAESPDSPGKQDFFLADFGLSMTKAAISKEPQVAGTLPYLAPEIRTRGAPTPASDIWSLGITLCETRGYWCPGERLRDAAYWMRKLSKLGHIFQLP